MFSASICDPFSTSSWMAARQPAMFRMAEFISCDRAAAAAAQGAVERLELSGTRALYHQRVTRPHIQVQNTGLGPCYQSTSCNHPKHQPLTCCCCSSSGVRACLGPCQVRRPSPAPPGAPPSRSFI
jgi:hypothetical protein